MKWPFGKAARARVRSNRSMAMARLMNPGLTDAEIIQRNMKGFANMEKRRRQENGEER